VENDYALQNNIENNYKCKRKLETITRPSRSPYTIYASEVTTIWRYTNVYIIIIIIIIIKKLQSERCVERSGN